MDVIDQRHVLVPVGVKAPRWTTVRPVRTVLLVASNVTAVTRLLDILPAFDNDTRVQVVFTLVGSDPFQHGLAKVVDSAGIIAIPWEQAIRTPLDLAISASHHRGLIDIPAPLVVLSHGIGYTKYLPRKQGGGSRRPYGLSAQWVLYDDEPIAHALVLSHDSQLCQLAEYAPAAVSSATVVGDPCFDRIVESVEFRERYRAALGVGDRTLVMVSSTWSKTSLLGSRPELLRELVAELALDTHLVAAALHPNIRHGHGPGQVSRWFADCVRSGLVLLPEIDGWRAGLIAADVIVGDHGSVTGYGAAIGRPVLLAAFDAVPPGTAISEMGQLAGRLPEAGPYAPYLAEAIRSHKPDRFALVTKLTTSAPGQSLARLRAVCYKLLNLPEPAAEVPIEIVPLPLPESGGSDTFADLVSSEVDLRQRVIRLVRRAAEVQRRNVGWPRDRDKDIHISCSPDYPVRSLVANAAVLVASTVSDLSDMREVFERWPACGLVAVPQEGSVTVWSRDGAAVTLDSPTVPARALASVAYAWRSAGGPLTSLAPTVGVELGLRRHSVMVRPAG